MTSPAARALTPLPTLGVALAVLLLFIAERIVGHGALRVVLLSAAAAAFAAAVGWRLWTRRGASPEAASLIGLQLGCHAVIALAAAGYVWAARPHPRDIEELAGTAMAASMVLFGVPLLLLAALEAAAAPMRRAGFVERLRWQQAAAAGLVAGFALAALALLNFAAASRDVRADLSYGAPAKPSEATLSLVQSSSRPVELFLFFEKGSAVLAEVADYYEALAAAGAELQVLDQALDVELARSLGVSQNGTVALRSGERGERWHLGSTREEARRKLKELDAGTRERLAKLTRDPLTVYMTHGHGERMEGSTGEGDRPAAGQFHNLAKAFNAKVKRLGLAEGFAADVPADASLVAIHGPTSPFLPAEVDVLMRYLERGGAVLLLLDPGSAHGLDALLVSLGLRAPPEPLANDREFVRQSQTAADHGFLFARSFVNHRAVRTLGESVRGPALLFRTAGRLERIDGGKAKVTFLARTRPFTFGDRDGDWAFDEGSEQRGIYELAAAIELPTAGGREARALVVADSDVLSDALVPNEANAAFGLDATLWLVRDDDGGGPVDLGDEVPVRHTREQDLYWFYGSTFALPLLVLSAGLLFVRARRRRPPRVA